MQRRHFFSRLLVSVVTASCLHAAEPVGPIRESDHPGPIKLACVGDSITEGAGLPDPKTQAYPAQLQEMLGGKWQVGNFGKSARTLLNAGDFPYQTTGLLKEALEFQPDVVIIMLGTNDSKPQNWRFKDQFVRDYKELIGKFKALPRKPRVFICRPVPVVGEERFSIRKRIVEEQMPLIAQVANDEQTGLIDMFGALEGHPRLLPDGVHPNAAGARRMAAAAYKALTGKEAPRP
jgi:lysophospholipase L1-like esterase